jgi:hypothetical protein
MFEFIDFLRQKWSEYSDATGQKGTVIDELAIKPTGLVLADFSNLLSYHVRINDIKNWETMSEDEMDIFGSKFFLPRIVGGIAAGAVRVYFAHKMNLDITDSFRAIGPRGLLYSAVRTGRIDKNSLIVSENGNEFYVDILVNATSAGDSYNREIGEITALSGVSFQYIRVSNIDRVVGGALREDNAAYYNRLRYAINDRSAMNKRSLYAIQKEFIPSISSAYISGPGDKYMTRDYVQAIDLSAATRKANFTGKIPKDNSVKNYAYFGAFPPEAGTEPAAFAGPFSIITAANQPYSIDPIDLLSSDPAYHGFPLQQEATSEMYQGLYFDDFQRNMEVVTKDLLNIADLNLGFNKIASPDASWLIGANARGYGDYGAQNEKNALLLSNIDMVSFSDTTVAFGAGFVEPLVVAKDVLKRTGLRWTGSVQMPTDETDISGTTVQFILGGLERGDSKIDAYSGIGFGIHIRSELETYVGPYPSPVPSNAIIFFSHSQGYAQNQIFASSGDIDPGSGVPLAALGTFGAIKEQATRLAPGEFYSFEFVIYDDLSLSLVFNKTSPIGGNDDTDIFPGMSLSKDVLSAFKAHILNADSNFYGTLAKVTVDSEMRDNTQVINVKDIKVCDITQRSSMGLYMFDVAKLEEPMSIRLRGVGMSYLDGIKTEGHRAYIWDTSRPPVAEAGSSSLANGAWVEIPELSNADGTKDSISNALTTTIQNATPYKVQSRYGLSIAILITTSGKSKMMLQANNELDPDVQAALNVDFLEIKSEPVDVYHSNNKVDINIVAIANGEDFNTSRVTLNKSGDESFFELSKDNGVSTPIVTVDNVYYVDGDGNETAIPPDAYHISRENKALYNSINEVATLSIDGNPYNTVIVEYKSYNGVKSAQDFYDSSERQKVYGDILVKHKRPVFLDLSIIYTGDGTQEDISQQVNNFFNQNQDDLFVTGDLSKFLFESGYVNNIKEPMGIIYNKVNDELVPVSGSVSDKMQITPIEFFRVNSVSAEKL